jgi:hypothetical protein
MIIVLKKNCFEEVLRENVFFNIKKCVFLKASGTCNHDFWNHLSFANTNLELIPWNNRA